MIKTEDYPNLRFSVESGHYEVSRFVVLENIPCMWNSETLAYVKFDEPNIKDVLQSLNEIAEQKNNADIEEHERTKPIPALIEWVKDIFRGTE